MVRNYSRGDPWVQARVIEQSGPVSYKVSVDSTNQVWRRHQDDIHRFSPEMVTDNFETMPNNSDSVATHKDDSQEKIDEGNSYHLFPLLIQVNLPVS